MTCFILCLSDNVLFRTFILTGCVGRKVVSGMYWVWLETKGEITIEPPHGKTNNREADQRICFRYSDSTIPLLLKSEISSF